MVWLVTLKASYVLCLRWIHDNPQRKKSAEQMHCCNFVVCSCPTSPAGSHLNCRGSNLERLMCIPILKTLTTTFCFNFELLSQPIMMVCCLPDNVKTHKKTRTMSIKCMEHRTHEWAAMIPLHLFAILQLPGQPWAIVIYILGPRTIWTWKRMGRLNLKYQCKMLQESMSCKTINREGKKKVS